MLLQKVKKFLRVFLITWESHTLLGVFVGGALTLGAQKISRDYDSVQNRLAAWNSVVYEMIYNHSTLDQIRSQSNHFLDETEALEKSHTLIVNVSPVLLDDGLSLLYEKAFDDIADGSGNSITDYYSRIKATIKAIDQLSTTVSQIGLMSNSDYFLSIMKSENRTVAQQVVLVQAIEKRTHDQVQALFLKAERDKSSLDDEMYVGKVVGWLCLTIVLISLFRRFCLNWRNEHAALMEDDW